MAQVRAHSRTRHAHSIPRLPLVAHVLVRFPLFPENERCPRPKFQHALDVYGDHLLHCNTGFSVGNAPLVWVHDAQLRLLAANLRRVALPPQLEYRAPMAHNLRPDIKFLGAQGEDDYIQLSIVHALSCADRMSSTISKPMVPLSLLETRKLKQHCELLERDPYGSRLLVFGMNTAGGWAESARAYMTYIARASVASGNYLGVEHLYPLCATCCAPSAQQYTLPN